MKLLYQEVILDHYKNPIGKGRRFPYTDEEHQVNPICGDEITVWALINDDMIDDLSYECQGCAISQASASVLAEQITGDDLDCAAEKILGFIGMLTADEKPCEGLLGDGVAFENVKRYPARVACALIPWLAAKRVIGLA
jgi:nitrogen fixation NifU-like protein